MKISIFIVVIFSIPLMIIGVISNYKYIDPLEKTNIVLNAEVISLDSISSGSANSGKTGSWVGSGVYSFIRIKVKAEDEKIYVFNKPHYVNYNIGDSVSLYLYKRKLTGIKTYILQ